MRRAPALQRLAMSVSGAVIAAGRRSGLPLQRWATRLATLARLPRYLSRLGGARGLRTCLQFAMSEDTVAVDLPGYERPIQVRCGTPDAVVFERIFIAEEYRAVGVLGHCAAILDCGAYVGYSSLYFAHRFPEAKILAVEPDPENMRQLELNTAQCPGVIPVKAAIWSRECALRIRNPGEEPWSFAVEESLPGAGTIAGRTIEQLMSEHGIARLDLLKMDIEGAEAEVFRAGARRWLSSARMLVIELHDYLYPGVSEPFFRAIHGLPFAIEAAGENLLLINLASTAHASEARAGA